MQVMGVQNNVKDNTGAGIIIQKSMKSDSYADGLRNQIATKQKNLAALNEDEEMSLEMKMKKRKELQQEIADLEAKARAHELEEKKKEEEKAKEKRQEENDKLMGNTRHTSRDGDTAHISKAGMQAIIEADKAIDNVEQTNGIRTSITDQSRILETEIKIDKMRGVDTSKKENDLADMHDHIAALSENVNEQITNINKAMKEDPDKEDDQEITDIDEQENSPAKFKFAPAY